MINSIAFNKAISLIKSSGLDHVCLTVDNKEVDLTKELYNFKFKSLKRLKKSQKNVFIEYDIDKVPGAIYVWVWSPEHPQYNWIKQTTKNKWNEGIFRVLDEGKGLLRIGSIYNA